MNANQYPITPDGLKKIKEDLRQLKTVDRVNISKEIGAAIEMGDLSENFEYHSAKDRQGMIEAKIRNLEGIISQANVINPAKLSGDKVMFGATVTLVDVDTDEEKCYMIVGEAEADIEVGRISVTSPLARAIINKEIGDEITIPSRFGKKSVEIAEVEYK